MSITIGKPGSKLTKPELVKLVVSLGALQKKTVLNRMRKADLEAIRDRLERLSEHTMTPAEFVERARNHELPTYYGAGYFPTWLTPHGKVLIGDSHASISSRVKAAHDIAESGTYPPLTRRGFIRLVPSSDMQEFGIEAYGYVPNEAQVEALREILPHWNLASRDRFDISTVNNQTVRGVDEAIEVLLKPKAKAA